MAEELYDTDGPGISQNEIRTVFANALEAAKVALTVSWTPDVQVNIEADEALIRFASSRDPVRFTFDVIQAVLYLEHAAAIVTHYREQLAALTENKNRKAVERCEWIIATCARKGWKFSRSGLAVWLTNEYAKEKSLGDDPKARKNLLRRIGSMLQA